MQAPLRIRFTLARMPSKNFIYFKPGRNTTAGVHCELPILMSEIKVEQSRPDVTALRTAPFVARTSLRNPLLTFAEPNIVFERVYNWA